jgi:hypothetical protein
MKKLIPTIGAVTGLLIGMPCLNAGGPDLKIERSVKVSFDSEVGKSYNAYSTTDVAKKKWELLGGPVDGSGEKIVFFYQSNDDQKAFFKVDEANGSGGGDDSGGVDHEWSGTSLRLKKANGQWGGWVDLHGQKGDSGKGVTREEVLKLTTSPALSDLTAVLHADIEKNIKNGWRLSLQGMNTGSDFLTAIDLRSNKTADILFSNGYLAKATYEKLGETHQYPRIVLGYALQGMNIQMYIDLVPDTALNNPIGHIWFGSSVTYLFIDGKQAREDRSRFQFGSIP